MTDDSSVEVNLGISRASCIGRYTYALSHAYCVPEQGQCGDMAPPFLGRRRGWCVPYSGPLLANKRTKNKGQREQEADRGQFLFRNVAAVWFVAKPCVRDSGPGPVNLVCLPNGGHTHLLLLSSGRELRHLAYCTAEPPRPPQ